MAVDPLSQRWDMLGGDNRERAEATAREIKRKSAQELFEHGVELFAISQTYGSGSAIREEVLGEAVFFGLCASYKQAMEARVTLHSYGEAAAQETARGAAGLPGGYPDGAGGGAI